MAAIVAFATALLLGACAVSAQAGELRARFEVSAGYQLPSAVDSGDLNPDLDEYDDAWNVGLGLAISGDDHPLSLLVSVQRSEIITRESLSDDHIVAWYVSIGPLVRCLEWRRFFGASLGVRLGYFRMRHSLDAIGMGPARLTGYTVGAQPITRLSLNASGRPSFGLELGYLFAKVDKLRAGDHTRITGHDFSGPSLALIISF